MILNHNFALLVSHLVHIIYFRSQWLEHWFSLYPCLGPNQIRFPFPVLQHHSGRKTWLTQSSPTQGKKRSTEGFYNTNVGLLPMPPDPMGWRPGGQAQRAYLLGSKCLIFLCLQMDRSNICWQRSPPPIFYKGQGAARSEILQVIKDFAWKSGKFK